MAVLLKCELAKQPRLVVIGWELKTSMAEVGANNPLPALWEKAWKEALFDGLWSQETEVFDPSSVGWMGNMGPDGSFTYVVGLLMGENAVVPEGCVRYELAPATVAVGWVQGKNTADCCSNAYQLTEAALKEKGYRPDMETGWCMELYQCPRFTEPDADGNIILDYYIPVIE